MMCINLHIKLLWVYYINKISVKICIMQRSKMCWMLHRISGKNPTTWTTISNIDLLTLHENLLFEILSCTSYTHVKSVTVKSYNVLFSSFNKGNSQNLSSHWLWFSFHRLQSSVPWSDNAFVPSTSSQF